MTIHTLHHPQHTHFAYVREVLPKFPTFAIINSVTLRLAVLGALTQIYHLEV